MAQENDGSWGSTASQGPPLPWSLEAHMQLHLIPIQHPGTSYSQLMVTVCKAESKKEEIWDKVRVRATVATDLGEGVAELGQQIAMLMAALNKAGQGSNPSSSPSSPWERGHNGISGPGQTTPACSLPTGYGTGGNGTGSNGQSKQGTGMRREGTANRQDPNSLKFVRCQGWATWQGNVIALQQL